MISQYKGLMSLRNLHRVFLQSEAWKEIRKRAFAHHGDMCQRCGQPATDIHHKTYIRWGGRETMEDLEVLCRPCHTAHHREEKRSMPEKPVTGKAKKKKKKKGASPKPKRPVMQCRNAFSQLTTKEIAQLQGMWPNRTLSVLMREGSPDGDSCRKKMAEILNCEDVVVHLDFRRYQPNPRKKGKSKKQKQADRDMRKEKACLSS